MTRNRSLVSGTGWLALVGLVGLALVAVLSFRWGAASGPDDARAAAPSSTPSAEETPSTAEVVDALAPSIVTIEASGGSGAGSGSGSPVSLGTGMIANADGTVLTAFHVVKDATAIRLIYADGTRSPARIATVDPATDIATLTAQTLPEVVVPVVLGGAAAIGSEVIAVGNQLGLIGSTTTGVVSGLGRTARAEHDTTLKGLIQFDAAVNRGSSGGPLVNARGEVVGVVVALANPGDTGTFIGIGFAVPIGVALGADGRGVPGPQV